MKTILPFAVVAALFGSSVLALPNNVVVEKRGHHPHPHPHPHPTYTSQNTCPVTTSTTSAGCHTVYGTKKPKHHPIPTTTVTYTTHYAPTTLGTGTTAATTTITSTQSNTATVNAVSTKTVATTTTVTTTPTPTKTPVNFVALGPQLMSSGNSVKRRDGGAVEARGHKHSYPKKVECDVTVGYYTTCPAPTATPVVHRRALKVRALTTTTATVTATTVTSFTSTTTVTTTATTTSTAPASTNTSYPACAANSNNYVSQINNNYIDGSFSTGTRNTLIYTIKTKEDCCKACQDSNSCIGFTFTGGVESLCSLVPPPTDSAQCPKPYNIYTFSSTNAPQFLTYAGNGNCGAGNVMLD